MKCDTCVHKSICKYKDKVAKMASEVEIPTSKSVPSLYLEVNCLNYNNNYYITSTTYSGSNTPWTSTTLADKTININSCTSGTLCSERITDSSTNIINNASEKTNDISYDNNKDEDYWKTLIEESDNKKKGVW
jgi:hypothetical protein